MKTDGNRTRISATSRRHPKKKDGNKGYHTNGHVYYDTETHEIVFDLIREW